jgi:signal peptidase II
MAADLLVMAGIILAVDQASKALVVRVLAERQAVWASIRLRCVRNARLVPRLLLRRPILIAFWAVATAGTVLAAAVIFTHDTISRAALGAALGGATGNLLDRLFRGAVVDFIDLRVWPVFNLADVAITAGVAVALVRAGFSLGQNQPV